MILDTRTDLALYAVQEVEKLLLCAGQVLPTIEDSVHSALQRPVLAMVVAINLIHISPTNVTAGTKNTSQKKITTCPRSLGQQAAALAAAR